VGPGGAIRERAGAGRHRPVRLAAAAVLAGAVALLPAPARAISLGGSLQWDLSRTESSSTYSSVTQETFGQNYRLNSSGYLVRHRIANWNLGGGWRADRTRFAGTSQPDRRVTITDLDAGLVLLPGLMPMTVNFRRSIVDSTGDATANQSTLSTTISFATQVPMRDGNPLGVSAYQTTLDPGTGTSRSRLFSLAKRFDLGRRSRLNTSYQFSQYHAPASESNGHGVSLSENTEWSDRLASNVFANVSSRSTTSTRLAGGRSLFLNNSGGASLFYRRGREVSANLAYSFSQSPQDQASDIRSHLLAGNATVRLDKKTDVNGRFALRRLDLNTVTLDTGTASVGLTYRPRFGWSTGAQVGVANNRTTGPSTTDRNTYSANLFLNARHDLEPVQITWGGNTAYSTTQGDFAQDRLTSTAQVGATERRLRWIRISGEYRFTDIREAQGGGLDPFTREHGLRLTGNVLPRRGIWLPSDVISGSVTTGVHWSRQYQSARNVRTADLQMEGRYNPFGGLTTTAGYELHDNSSDVGGADQVLRANVAWSRSMFRRGSLSLTGDVRRNYTGGNYQSQQATARTTYDYAVGLLHVALSADFTTVDLAGSGSGTDTNSVRLSVVRTF
jgi:hypothetical protein